MNNPMHDLPSPPGRAALRRLPIAGFLIGLLALPALAEEPEATGLTLTSYPIKGFQIGYPNKTRFGPLEWLGGLDIEADTKDFGGLSALGFLNDGRLVAVTDTGFWLNARLRFDQTGRPLALEAGELRSLKDFRGEALEGKHFSDAEALALVSDDGQTTAYIGFERIDRILAYPLDAAGHPGLPSPVAAPFSEGRMRYSKGIEALVKAARDHPLAGSLIAISERTLDGAGNMVGWLIGGPRPGQFSLLRSDEFDVTDAAFLPGGDLLVLERRFRLADGVAMRLRQIHPDEIRPGRIIEGRIVFAADMNYVIDNMEGLTVTRDEGGATYLTLISDDNHSILQRNLVLRFRWHGEEDKAVTPPGQTPNSAE